jgi:hypothetical protein
VRATNGDEADPLQQQSGFGRRAWSTSESFEQVVPHSQ